LAPSPTSVPASSPLTGTVLALALGASQASVPGSLPGLGPVCRLLGLFPGVEHPVESPFELDIRQFARRVAVLERLDWTDIVALQPTPPGRTQTPYTAITASVTVAAAQTGVAPPAASNSIRTMISAPNTTKRPSISSVTNDCSTVDIPVCSGVCCFSV
jgi:hypothetical protein